MALFISTNRDKLIRCVSPSLIATELDGPGVASRTVALVEGPGVAFLRGCIKLPDAVALDIAANFLADLLGTVPGFISICACRCDCD